MPNPVTAAEREQWRALCEAATPGPWHAESIADGVRHLERNESWYFEKCPDSYNLPGRQGGDGGRADGAFIAAAREALPRLLDLVEQLERERSFLLAQGFLPDGEP